MSRYKRMVDAAHDILTNRRKPMHYREITRTALKKKTINVTGKTPEMSMVGVLNRDPRFYRFGAGIYGLLSWQKVKRSKSRVKAIDFNERTLSEIRKVLRSSDTPLHYVDITMTLLETFRPLGDHPEAVVKGLLNKAKDIVGDSSWYYVIP